MELSGFEVRCGRVLHGNTQNALLTVTGASWLRVCSEQSFDGGVVV